VGLAVSYFPDLRPWKRIFRLRFFPPASPPDVPEKKDSLLRKKVVINTYFKERKLLFISLLELPWATPWRKRTSGRSIFSSPQAEKIS
jgi:hypothetical protein